MGSFNLIDPNQWHGIWTALVTPLKKNSHGSLEIDQTSLKKLIDLQLSTGLRGLVIGGSTGEGSLLGEELYSQLLQSTIKIAAGRVPLVAGIGIGGTESCLKNLRLAKSLGFSGALASPPAYIKTPQRGLVQHFLCLAREEFPLCIYEVPSRSCSSIQVETLQELVRGTTAPEAKYLVATKDASNDLERARKQVKILSGRMALLSGEDASFPEFRKLGGQGLISVASHVIPNLLLETWRAPQTLKPQVLKFIDELFMESNPIPIKSLLARMGVISEATFCPPLLPMKPELLEKLQQSFLEACDASA